MHDGSIQSIASYYAIFEAAEEGGYNVWFPDFPGCVTFGQTFEDAREHAAEVLELWIQELKTQQKEIPHRRVRPIVDEVAVAAM